MSMPQFPQPPDFTQEQALTMILSSIALEEAALSHIINAEGEKIQYVLGRTKAKKDGNIEEILAVNESVSKMLDSVLQNQMILKNKMERVLEYLPKPPPLPPIPPPLPPPCPYPPKPPAPCPPAPAPCPPCHEHDGCCPQSKSICFIAERGCYCCNEALRWKGGGHGCSFSPVKEESGLIRLPPSGVYAMDICLDNGSSKCPVGELKMEIFSHNSRPIIRKFNLKISKDEKKWRRRLILDVPCSCRPSYLRISICSPLGAYVDTAKIIFTDYIQS